MTVPKRLMRLVCLLCAMCLLLPAALAEEVVCGLPADCNLSEGETPIEQRVPDYVPKLLAIAAGELGYVEGPDNQSKYGEWAGDAHAAWCAEFVCWCVSACDEQHGTALSQNIYPRWSGQNTGRDWFIRQGRFVFRKGYCAGWGYQWQNGDTHYLTKAEFIPAPGDLLFFSYNAAGDTEHVALIEYMTRTGDDVMIHVIEGNNPDRVQRASYPMSSSQVLGFGITRPLIRTTMRSGCEGVQVLEMQQMLCDLGYLDDADVSGKFLNNTQDAVRRFQQEHLPARTHYGIADIDTVNTLLDVWDAHQLDEPDNWLVED